MTCKVDEVADKYGLSSLDDRVLRRREQEDASLRALEAYVNQRILRAAMEQAGMRVLEGDPENYHRILTNDDVMDATRNQVRRELEQEGVPLDDVLGDMVSYQTVRHHLKECLDTDTSRNDKPTSRDKAEVTFRRLESRSERVVKRTLDRLRKHDMIDFGELDVSVSLNVTCGDCGHSYSVYETLGRRRCACRDRETDFAEWVDEQFSE